VTIDLGRAEACLAQWLRSVLADADAGSVPVARLGKVMVGHSAETLLADFEWLVAGAERGQQAVVRLRPPKPALLEPYDLGKQFAILQGLEATRVRSPRPLWLESTGTVLGQEFYVMERVAGSVYKTHVPYEVATDQARIRRMSESMVEQIAAVHSVDLAGTRLHRFADGGDPLQREIDRWSAEVRRVQRGPLPALEQLICAVRSEMPPIDDRLGLSLVHGNLKPGNFAFGEAGEVTALFNWDLATVGDPMTDIGWTEWMWRSPGSFTRLPTSLTSEQFIAMYERLTGNRTRYRPGTGHWPASRSP
jgi:aminoglycoside phosphotransferase (APT) family kinase protein